MYGEKNEKVGGLVMAVPHAGHQLILVHSFVHSFIQLCVPGMGYNDEQKIYMVLALMKIIFR